MFGIPPQFVGACVLSMLLAGCTQYQQIEAPTVNRELNIGRYRANVAVNHEKVFQDLQQRINALERKKYRRYSRSPKGRRVNRNYRNRTTINRETIGKIFPGIFSSITQESAMGQIQLKVNAAVTAIEKALNSLEKITLNRPTSSDAPPTELHTESSTEPSTKPYAEPSPAVRNVVPDDSVQVTQDIEITNEKEQQFKYSVIYRYTIEEPWTQMWKKLEDANEQDKWRGVSKGKSSYFIYVGVYLREDEALNRQQYLLGLTGEKPDLRKRAIKHTLIQK